MATRLSPGPRMSQAVAHAGVLYTAGQVDDVGPDVTAQTQNILAKIDDLLATAGTDKSHVLSANIWLTDMKAFDEMNAVWEKWIDVQAPPARATVESALAFPSLKVEIAVIAAIPNSAKL